LASESAQKRRKKAGEVFGWTSREVVEQARTPQVFGVLAAVVEVA
jgi:hypothetical protein